MVVLLSAFQVASPSYSSLHLSGEAIIWNHRTRKYRGADWQHFQQQQQQHHSISVLGRPETRYWEEVFTPLYLVEGSVQHMHGDWGFSIRLAIQAGSCMITPRSVYWWSLFLCHCTQEHWNRLIARVFSNGADTSPQH